MKLADLAAARPTKQYSKVFESYFGQRFDVDRLTAGQVKKMLYKVRATISEHQKSVSRHHSERNPGYLKLVIVEQTLAARLNELAPPVAGTAAGTSPEQQKAQQAMATATISATKDPALKAALQKAAKGQGLTPDEQKLVAGAALMKAESKLTRAYRMLKESEVQQAQVVLAAQDMVDKMQSMLEDVSELQFKELPALVDSIKNQVGTDQAMQFNTDATAALTGLLQNIQGAKQQLDAALGVVTGQTPAGAEAMAADLGAETGAAMGADAGAMAGAEAGAEAGDELDAAASDAMAAGDQDTEQGSAADLGRARR